MAEKQVVAPTLEFKGGIRQAIVFCLMVAGNFNVLEGDIVVEGSGVRVNVVAFASKHNPAQCAAVAGVAVARVAVRRKLKSVTRGCKVWVGGERRRIGAVKHN